MFSDAPPPLYVDSASTVLVANNDTSVKRSVWTIRRAIILQEAVVSRIVDVVKVHESRNLADLFTKYLKYSVWHHHIMVLLNAIGVPPRPPIEWRIG